MIRYKFLLYLIGTVCFAFSEANEGTTPLVGADAYYDAGLFDRAVGAYLDLLEANPDGAAKAEISLKLAQSYYQQGLFAQAVDVLEMTSPTSEGQLLMGMSYNHLGLYDKAIEILDQVQSESKFYELAHYELGLSYYRLGQSDKAYEIFGTASKVPLSQIYAAKIDLENKRYTLALSRLKNVEEKLTPSDPLQFEIAFIAGEIAYQTREYKSAVAHFEKALPKPNPITVPWFRDTMLYLGHSYLKLGDDDLLSRDQQRVYFQKATDAYLRLLESPDLAAEKVYLALAQCYLTIDSRLQDSLAKQEADKLLSNTEFYYSPEAKMEALLLRAQAASSHQDRERIYRQITVEGNQFSSFYAKAWYLRGMNDFEEGEVLEGLHRSEEANRLFERSITAFQKAFELFSEGSPKEAALALKYQAQTLGKMQGEGYLLQGLAILERFSGEGKTLGDWLDDPDEIFYLKGLLNSRLFYAKGDSEYFNLAEEALKTASAKFPKGRFLDRNLHLLGILYYKEGLYQAAEKAFLRISQDSPSSSLSGDGLFWVAKALEAQNKNPEEVKRLRQEVYSHYPESKYASEAYFTVYSYRDYLQGERPAIKHLQSFVHKYPNSPFVMIAHYLIGLDYKRDRKSPEGKWIRKRNLTASIDAFQEVDSTFDSLCLSEQLSSQDLEYFITVKYRATLERALTNLAIAEESQGTKKQIYLDYAQEVFKQIIQDFSSPFNSLTAVLKNKEPFPSILEESSYWLAQTNIKSGKDMEAYKILQDMLDTYQRALITRGYYLSRAWRDLAMLDNGQGKPQEAIVKLLKAEDAAKGRILSPEQKLELWLDQAACFEALNQQDQALLVLSKAINDDSISGLRIKAMFLRAEIYEKQGRQELARKHFEATSRKGGEWGQQAKFKLEQKYGY